jgi:hypothetical protein
MARRFKLRDLEKQKGKALDVIIVPLVNKGGQKLAAEKLGVSQSAISDWLRENNYTSITMWMKKTTPQEHADIDAAHDRVNARRVEQGRPTLEEEEEFS